MSFDFKYKLNKHKNIYGSLLIDEWMPSKTFSKKKIETGLDIKLV